MATSASLLRIYELPVQDLGHGDQDGSVISVPRNRLSEGDQEFIDRQLGSADNPFQP